MNAPVINLRIADDRAAWMYVGKAWQDGNPACDECPFARTEYESRPYGIGCAYEAMSECTLGHKASDRPESCPAYQAQMLEDMQ